MAIGPVGGSGGSSGVYVPVVTEKRFNEMTDDWGRNTPNILGTGAPVSPKEQGDKSNLETLWETLYRGQGPMAATFRQTLQLMEDTYGGSPEFLETFATVVMAKISAGYDEMVAQSAASTAARDAAWEAREQRHQAANGAMVSNSWLFGI